MHILLAKPRGFCAGVEMAVESVELALEMFGAPLYVYHEIVHNTHVVRHFRERGVRFVDDVAQVPEGSPLLYSAHGVSPEVRRQARARRLQTIDATCPLVAKVHREAIRFSRAGYSIILIGHAGHDEVLGTLGEAPEQIVLVEAPDDVDRLQIADAGKVAYLTQTTLSPDDVARIIARLKQRFPHIIGPATEDICYATQNRQEAVRRLLDRADAVLVVGSRNSSNSNRLVEIARAAGKPAYLVDGGAEIEQSWFHADESVLLTAGASAPEESVQDCLQYLAARFAVTIEECSLREETQRFPLPSDLRRLQHLQSANASNGYKGAL